MKKKLIDNFHVIAGDIGGTNCRFQLGKIDLKTLVIERIMT